jgi:hypothetical protein
VGDSRVIREVQKSFSSPGDRSELGLYLIKFPHLDYWIWDMLYRTVEAFVSDFDVTHAGTDYFTHKPGLIFGGAATTPDRIKALAETVKRILQSGIYSVGWLIQALTWFGMRTFPIAERVHNAFKRSAIQNLFDALEGIPFNTAIYNYLLKSNRVLYDNHRGTASQLFLYPLWIYEFTQMVEAIADTDLDDEYELTTPDLLPDFFQLNRYATDDAAAGGFSHATSGVTAQLESDYGLIVSYIYHRLTAGRDYMLDSMGFARDEGLIMTDDMRELINHIGLFDMEFSLDKVVADVNGMGVFSASDFVRKFQIALDRPRPVLRPDREPTYATPAASPQSQKWYPNPTQWIRNGATGIETDRYAMVKIDPDTHPDQLAAALGQQDWDQTNAVMIGTTNMVDGCPIVGQDWAETVLKHWWASHSQLFYLPDADFLDSPLNADQGGTMFIVHEEITLGYFGPRYAVSPLIDPYDLFQCGWFKILSNELKKGDDWSNWAANFVNNGAAALGTVSKNWWESKSATLIDIPMWLGAGFYSTPGYYSHHYLAEQPSHYYGTATPADQTYAAIPFTVFGLHWAHNSIVFAGVEAEDAWDAALECWDTAAAEAAWDHEYKTTSANRMALWRSLMYPDPLRQVGIRYANQIWNMVSKFVEIQKWAKDDFNALFSVTDVANVEVTKDIERFLSNSKLAVMKRRPATQGGATQRTESGDYTPSKDRGGRSQPRTRRQKPRTKAPRGTNPPTGSQRTAGSVSDAVATIRDEIEKDGLNVREFLTVVNQYVGNRINNASERNRKVIMDDYIPNIMKLLLSEMRKGAKDINAAWDIVKSSPQVRKLDDALAEK